MPCPIHHPCFGLAVRERDGDERGACVVCANLLARVGALEEDRAIDAGGEEMLAVLRGGVVDVDTFAMEVDEDEVAVLGGDVAFGEEDAPCSEAACDARRQGPRSRVVRLVDVEHDAAAIEVEVAPGEARRFVDARTFTMEEPIKDAVLDGYVGRRDELGVFVGVDPTLRFAGSDFREESRR